MSFAQTACVTACAVASFLKQKGKMPHDDNPSTLRETAADSTASATDITAEEPPPHHPLITRKQAEAVGANRYYTGKSCKRGHLAQRYVKTGICVGCQKERDDLKCRVKAAEHQKDYYRRNREAVLQRGRERDAQFLPGDLAIKARSNAIQRAPGGKLQAPDWPESEKIGAMYAEARRLTKETGVRHQVDHVVPLRGVDFKRKRNVSGLHIARNLRIVSADENIKKGNHFEVETIVH